MSWMSEMERVSCSSSPSLSLGLILVAEDRNWSPKRTEHCLELRLPWDSVKRQGIP